jgi:predicted Zn-dependent protease with MMP-like domain
MDREDFEVLVAEALENLPQEFKDRLQNVAITVEDWPDRHTMKLAGVIARTQLLGFYHGVPQTQRSHYYGLVAPDRITLYQRPIELHCSSPDEVREMVEHVLRHEIAHHFGIGDDRLRELGAY